MSSFIGGEVYSIDSRNRVKIPFRMLKSLSNEANDSFVLTRGHEKCIYAYPYNEWVEIEKKLKELNPFDEKDRFFLRRFLMWSEETVLDAQKRIVLPGKLVEFAEIKDEVSIVGVVNHIEIWNPVIFDQYIKSLDEEYDKISQEVMTR